MSDLDDRLRAALHDLDHRVAQSLTREPAPRRVIGWGRPALVGMAVVGLLVLVGLLIGPGGSTTPAPPAATTPATTPATPHPSGSPAVSPSTIMSASQQPAEARRDGIPARIGALPLTWRLAPVEPVTTGARTRIDTPEGRWVISRPDLTESADPDTGCVKHTPGDVDYQACSDWSEILWMSPDGSGIIKAFPVPDRPVQWITLTADALYFGAEGDGAVPDSILGRIDRTTFALTGRVYPYRGPDMAALRNFRGWPGDWSNARRGTEDRYAGVRVKGDRLQILDDNGKAWSTVDPVTLR